MEAIPKTHPCTRCGACCAQFNVYFYWRETRAEGFLVPAELAEEVDAFRMRMKSIGTKQLPRCVALNGKVGESSTCSIYEHRPSPCREFKASYEDGKRHKRCDEARLTYGLLPLKPSDW